ncbi:MAG: hypothetical protein DHS20C04_04490 [Hyphococcus sp.]|nr:MAG: hypothetical protein DHS20C04_04490 [Marinicaulis sp.]
MVKIYNAVDFHTLLALSHPKHVQILSVNCYKAIKILYVIMNKVLMKNAVTPYVE